MILLRTGLRGIRAVGGVLALLFLFPVPVMAQSVPGNPFDYRLGPGDVVRITVYNNPDLSTEAQITRSGRITFPLLGEVEIGGLEKAQAEEKLARLLGEGKYVVNPQVNVLIAQYRSQQVSVLGQVNKPGMVLLERASNLSDLLAFAGGIAQGGSDIVIVLSRGQDGKAVRREVDVNALLRSNELSGNVPISGGDIIYVPRAPLFYIYGEVQRPGAFRLEHDMTVMQALSVGGGLTVRGTERGIRVNRRGANGDVQTIEPRLTDRLRENDVIFVRESLF